MLVAKVRIILIGACILVAGCAARLSKSEPVRAASPQASGEQVKVPPPGAGPRAFKPSNIKGSQLEVRPSGDLVPVIGRDSGLSLF